MKKLLIFLVILLPFSVFAQSNYYAGYVIKSNGDTLKGYIDYHEWAVSPRSINFKINKADRNIQLFDPLTVTGFQINGLETYISYIGDISMNRTNISDLPNDLDTSKIRDTTFLRQLTTGSHLNLYYQSDDIKNRFFIAEIGGQPTELKQYEYLNDGNQVVNTSIYKGQLLLYINKFQPGNDGLISKVERTPYIADDLERIVDAINGNKSASKKRSTTRYYVGLGINNTATQLASAIGGGSVQTVSSVSPQINAGIDIFTNPNIQQFIFRIEVCFSYANPQLEFGGVYKFNQYNGTIAPQLLFNVYNKNKIKVYIDGGLGFNLSGYTNNELNSGGSVVKKPYKLENYWINFPFQVGVVINKRLEFCFTYSRYAAYTNYVYFSVANQSTGFGVKYLLAK